jgi:hypothetical protein
LEDTLARRVLAGEFPAGTRIVVDRGPSGELTFTSQMRN